MVQLEYWWIVLMAYYPLIITVEQKRRKVKHANWGYLFNLSINTRGEMILVLPTVFKSKRSLSPETR